MRDPEVFQINAHQILCTLSLSYKEGGRPGRVTPEKI